MGARADQAMGECSAECIIIVVHVFNCFTTMKPVANLGTLANPFAIAKPSTSG